MCHKLNPSSERVTYHRNIALLPSRMANALHRSQTRLWRAQNRSLFTAVIGTRWMSNLKSQSPLSDIEVPSIFIVHIVLMSVPELAWKAKDPQGAYAEEIARTGISEIWS